MALSLGAEGVSHLEAGQWQASANYRFLYADKGYVGADRDPFYKQRIGARLTLNSLDLQLTYAFTVRYSATLTMPFVYGEVSDKLNHDGNRHTTSAGGLGDIRLVGSVWLLNPHEYKDGNLSLGCGVKFPTGDYKATDTFYRKTGPEIRPVDIAIQPGDGGWGIQTEVVGYHKIRDRLYGYVSGFYLFNPRETNGAFTTLPYPAGTAVRPLSVPDQYLGRLGFNYGVWPEQNVSVSLGARIDGIPPRDAIGGSEGFRRPGYSLYIEPGGSWTYGKNTLNLFVPVLVGANRQKNIYDDRYGNRYYPGAFADAVVIASYTRQF
jgi:hypothetical protein